MLASEFHQRRVESYEGEIAVLRRKDVRISTARLVSFLGALVLFVSGAVGESPLQLGLGVGAALLFIVFLILHARVLKALEAATIRRDIHGRHVARTDGRWLEFPQGPEDDYPSDHAYAWDIDVAGQGSLVQRVDVSGTRLGEVRLREWLGESGALSDIVARQGAVAELATDVGLRAEFEAAAAVPSGSGKLDGSRFLEFTTLPSFFESRPWLKLVAIALPLLTVSSLAASAAGISPYRIWPFTLLSQFVLLLVVGAPLRRVYDLVTARRGALEAFEGMLLELERASFESPLLVDLQARVSPGGRPPSAHL
ncbi:MAG: hypothetical protein AAF997_23760, partial [Myxococcota bacterium]